MSQRPRKTIEVATLRAEINRLLRLPTLTQEQKAILCSLQEHFLMQTDNYQGFNWTKWLDGGCDQWHKDGEPEDKTSYLGLEYDRTYF